MEHIRTVVDTTRGSYEGLDLLSSDAEGLYFGGSLLETNNLYYASRFSPELAAAWVEGEDPFNIGLSLNISYAKRLGGAYDSD